MVPYSEGAGPRSAAKGEFLPGFACAMVAQAGSPQDGRDETFQELYDRARMFEQREKQHAESAALHDGGDNS